MRLMKIMRWKMCTATAGCTLEDGHGGDCKLAKGF
jgi:hypothetical protein